MPNEVVGVVGAGTMGSGIAQVAVEAGHEVVLYDVDAAARDRGRERIRDGLTRRATRLADGFDRSGRFIFWDRRFCHDRLRRSHR